MASLDVPPSRRLLHYLDCFMGKNIVRLEQRGAVSRFLCPHIQDISKNNNNRERKNYEGGGGGGRQVRGISIDLHVHPRKRIQLSRNPMSRHMLIYFQDLDREVEGSSGEKYCDKTTVSRGFLFRDSETLSPI